MKTAIWLLARTNQVSQVYVLNGDADLDRESVGWSIRSIYGLYNVSEAGVGVCDRDRVDYQE